MPVRKRKPSSPARRFQTVSDFSEITQATPEKTLLAKKTSTGGRNNNGRMTSRHRGGGHKQRYRTVDFRRTKDDVEAKVKARLGRSPVRTEGIREQQWTLIDYGDVVVHVFLESVREFYEIERLYMDARRVEWEAPGVDGD